MTSPLHSSPGRVAVIGCGYVGLTTAACLTHLGNDVVAIDIDHERIDDLLAGRLPIMEQGLDHLVAEGRTVGRLEFSSSYRSTIDASVVLLCLPTPFLPDGGLDLRSLQAAAETLREHLAIGATVVTKSTVPVGTSAALAGWLDRPDVAVASNPEFLREGSAVADFLHPDRIVIGAQSSRIHDRIAALYRGIDARVQYTDPASAELIKYAANTFLATKLSFVNEISRLCDQVGGDIDDVVTGLGSDHRIGDAFLRPGPGWGGSCFPKDTRGLTYLARSTSQDLPVAEAAHASNQIHLAYMTDEIARLCTKPLPEANVAVWGATFKAGTDDLRDSPALEIVDRLQQRGATVTVYDPAGARDHIPATTVGDPYSACVDADILAVLTEWPEFGSVDFAKVESLMSDATVFDTRYVIDCADAGTAGVRVHRPGKRND